VRPSGNSRERAISREIMKLELRQQKQLAAALQSRPQEPRQPRLPPR
jgi:hypothetical protein